uniref:Uncharacterized protein n=1 Tax=Tanacetum cinerariifolium TaxID=118510 RepID=A0A699H4P0_TANCI|nr:hypothetical protein [Tanacetum cinerariifolium]
MSTANQQTLAELRASDRPPILEKRSYVPWASGFLMFLDNKKEERELMRNSIDKDSQIMWARIKRLSLGSKISQQERHSRLMKKFDKFMAVEEESLTFLYERFATLINVMDRNKEKMPLVTKDEARVHLNEEDNDFMLDNAYEYNTLEELNAAVIMIKRIQTIDNMSDAKPNYDTKFISEVTALQIDMINGLLSQSDHEQCHFEKLKTIIHISTDDQIDSDIIFDDPCMDNNKAEKQRKMNIELEKQQALLQWELEMCKERVKEFKNKPNQSFDYKEAYEELQNKTSVEKERLLNEKKEIHEEILKTQDETLKIKHETNLYKKASRERENKYLEDIVSLEEKLRSQRLKKAIEAQPKMYDGEKLKINKLKVELPDYEETLKNLEGENLLTGSRDSNLYTISIPKMAASSPDFRKLLVDNALSYALTATADVPPATLEYIQPFLKIGDYQGLVDKVSAFYTKNLAQPWHTMFKVFNHCLTTRTSGHDQTKINIFRSFMLTPRATRTPNPADVVENEKGKRAAGETSSPKTSLKICVKQQKPISTPIPPLKDFSTRLEPGIHKENLKTIEDDDDEEKKDKISIVGGRGVKKKNLNKNTMNTSSPIGVSMKSDVTLNEDTPVCIASTIQECVTPSVVDMMVEMEKISSLEDTTALGSFPLLFTLVTTTAGNAPGKIDVVVPVESIRAISKRFSNTTYGFFLGKKVAYPVVASYGGHYTCNIRVEYECKPPRCTSCKVFIHNHEECPKNISSGETKNLKKTSQALKGILVGQKVGIKPIKEYRHVPKKHTANSTSNKKKGVDSTNKASDSNHFKVLNSFDNDMDMGTNGGTSNFDNNEDNSSGSSFWNVKNSSTSTTPITVKIGKFENLVIDGQAILVDEAGNPLKKV